MRNWKAKMNKYLRKIYMAFAILGCTLFLGCASIVHAPTSVNGVPDQNLALLATAGSAEKNTGAGIISNVDGSAWGNGWKYKLAPGLHTFTLTPRGTSTIVQHQLYLEAGKRYDIEFDGTVWVRNRAGLDDSKFIGNNSSIQPFGIMHPAAGGGYISSSEQADRDLLSIKKQQQLLKDKELQAEAKSNRQKVFLSKKLEIGTKICQLLTGNTSRDGGYVRGILSSSPSHHVIWDYSGTIKLVAFVEQDTGTKLQVRVSGINFNGDSNNGGGHYCGQLDQLNYKEGTLRPGSLAWDEKSSWSYCD